MTVLIGVSVRPMMATPLVLLGEAIERVGLPVVYANRASLSKMIRTLNPAVTIINGVASLGDLESLRQHSELTRFIVVPSEGLFWDDYPAKTKFISREHCSCIDRFFLWGQSVAQRLQDLNFASPQQCVVTGRLQMDLLDHFAEARKRRTSGVLPRSRSRIRFGFISRFNTLNIFDRRGVPKVVFENMSNDKLEGEVEDMLWYSIKTMRRYYEILDHLMKNDAACVSWRPHPEEDLTAYRFLKERYGDRFEINYGTQDLAEWLVQQDCLLMPFSTSFVEATAMGVPVISVNNLLDRPELDFSRPEPSLGLISPYRLGYKMREFFYHPGTRDELNALLDQACAGSLRPKAFDPGRWNALLKTYYDYPRDEPTHVTMTRHILDRARETQVVNRPMKWKERIRQTLELRRIGQVDRLGARRDPWFQRHQLLEQDIPFHRQKILPIIEPHLPRLNSLVRIP